MEYAKHDELFCSSPEHFVQPQEVKENYGHLCSPYILNIYKYLKCDIRGTEKDTVFWKGNISVSVVSFEGIVQLCSDNTAMLLKLKPLIEYPAWAMLLNFSHICVAAQ